MLSMSGIWTPLPGQFALATTVPAKNTEQDRTNLSQREVCSAVWRFAIGAGSASGLESWSNHWLPHRGSIPD